MLPKIAKENLADYIDAFLETSSPKGRLDMPIAL